MDRKDLYDAVCAILAARSTKTVSWAIGYTEELRKQIRADASDEEIRVQCLYILNNIRHWRGTGSTRARATLLKYATK
jgi:hypothetical protein